MIDKAIERIRAAVDRFKPVATVALFSGGHDSATANLVAHEAGADMTLHIDTGIGVEQTRDYVREICSGRNWNLKEYKASENVNRKGVFDPQIYADMVRQYGFPGPFMHTKMYNRLKQRQLERFERDIGATPANPVLYVSGVRMDESKRRMRHITGDKEVGINRDGAHRVFCSPIYDFKKRDCLDCMSTCGLKRNEVVDLIHKSGECLCGAYAEKGELAELKVWFPETAKIIEDLEREVWHKFPWKWEDPGPPKWYQEMRRGQEMLFDMAGTIDDQPLCNRCNINFERSQKAVVKPQHETITS